MHRFGQGIVGLWFGVSAGYVVMIAALLVYMLRVDWPLQARLAVARAAPPAEAEVEEQSRLMDGDGVESAKD